MVAIFSFAATVVDEGTTFDKDPSGEGKIVMESFLAA